MNDEYFERLKANDPASAETPDLTSIKARIDAHTADNVVPLTSRRQFGRGLQVAAAVGALALAGGIGFAGGSLRTTPVATSESITADGPVSVAANDSASRSAAGGAPMATDQKMAASYVGGGGYWGSAILKPGSGVTNSAGTASSYAYRVGAVDKYALANALAAAVGIDGVKATAVGNGAVQVAKDDGSYNVYVGEDAMMWFSGYNNVASPWNCDSVKTGAGTNGKEITADQQTAAQTECDAEWTTPSKSDAIAAARKVVASLGLDVMDQAKYGAYTYSTRSMTVVVTPLVDGMEIGNTWQVEVSKNGVFSISGYAATPVKAQAYPIVGARDAAARSELRKWQAFGPQQVFDADQQVIVNGVQANFGSPVVRTKDGKPMLQAYISEIAVQSAVLGVMQVNLVDGTSMMMPAWVYTAADGSRWQMLAIADSYIDWEAQPANGPIAYASDTGIMAK